MRRTISTPAALLAVGILAGCASVPEWVKRGSGVFADERGGACYAVGSAAHDPNAQLQHDVAKMNARVELARRQKTYVAELILDFTRKHQDWFDPRYADSVHLYQQTARQVTEAMLYGSREVEQWCDRKGDHGERGTLYVLMMVPLDDGFFDAVANQYRGLIQEHKARLLKKGADEMLKELDEELQKARQRPLGMIPSPAVPGGSK